MNPAEGGPFDLILGIPVHPLVVHAVVVLVPLAATGLIVMALWPKFSRQYGWLVLLAAAGGAVSSFVAKEAGEALADRIGAPGFNHQALGSRLPLFALALLLVAIARWAMDRARAPGDATRQRGRMLVAVLAVLIAGASIFWVIRVGHTGAQSVWSGVAAMSAPDRP